MKQQITARGLKTAGVLVTVLASLATVAPFSAHAFAATRYVGAHSYKNNTTGDVFLGGDYLELGLSKYGSIGTTDDEDTPLPTHFYGADDRTNVGLVTNPSGFGISPDLRMDYVLPGTPEARWNVGYTSRGVQYHGSNGYLVSLWGGGPGPGPGGSANLALGMTDNTVTNQSSRHVLKATSVGTFNSKLKTTQVFTFGEHDKFVRVNVTLKNISRQSLDSVRYMQNIDPDNTRDQDGTSLTRNAVPYTYAEDGKAVVVADTNTGLGDPVYDAIGSYSPLMLYSTDSRARASTFGFSNPNVYDDSAYDDASPRGTVEYEDNAISMAFDVGTLSPGQSANFTYYISVDTHDVDSAVNMIVCRRTVCI